MTIFMLSAIGALSIINSQPVSAYFRENIVWCQPWDVYHESDSTFFNNQCVPYYNSSAPMRVADANGDRGYLLPRKQVGGTWVPALQGVTNVEQFISLLQSYRSSKNPRTWAATAFMYYSLGNSSRDEASSSGGRNVTSSYISNIEQRLRQPGVSINPNVSFNNSHTSTAINDGGDGDAYFNWVPTIYVPTFVIYYNGAVVAAFNYETAAPVAYNDGVDIIPYTAPSWQLNSDSVATPSTPTPGSSVTFTHRITNVGSSSATGVWWQTSGTIGTAKNSGGTITINAGSVVTVTDTATIPAGAAPGSQFCQQISFNPVTPGGGSGSSAQGCVTVSTPPPTSYDLAPSVSVSSGVTTIGGSATYTYNVNKTSTVANTSQSTDLTVRQIVIAPGLELPAGMKQAHDNANCAAYTGMGSGIACSNVATLPARTFTANTTVSVGNNNVSLASFPPGTQICRVLSLDPKNHNAKPNSRDSVPSCTILSTSPYLAGVGGDIFAGGGVSMATCNDPGRFRGSSLQGVGSFGEYGTLSVGAIENIYSSGTLVSPNKNHLMFANSSLPGGSTAIGGFYTNQHCIENYVSSYQSLRDAIGTTSWTGGSLASANVFNIISGPLTIGANTLPLNKKVIIYAPGQTVTINGNISYANGANSFAQVPSLTVIAQRINVTANVTSISGVFYANGIFHTCIEAGDNPNNNKDAIKLGGTCSNQLRVNGSVIATTVVTPRTNGGVSGSSPAEMFVYRPEAFLTMFEQNSTPTGITTDLTQELPPRY